jgi:hypothetical protein
MVVVVVVIYNIYIIYVSLTSLSRFAVIFLEKKISSNLHHFF